MRDEPKKKFNVKKIILMGLGVIAAMIVVAAISLWIFYVAAFTTYRNDKDGVTVAYPRSWIIKEHPETNVIVVFVSPKDTALDTFYETLNFSTYDMSQNPHDTARYVDILVAQLEMIFADLQMVEKKPFFIAGQPGYRIVFKMIGDLPKVIVVYAFTIDETGYNLLYMGDADKFSRDVPLMDLIALTMKVNPWVL